MEERDFFISYQSEDRSWAEWVAWTLEEHGFSVHVQAWDFRPGRNFVREMEERISKSKRVIGILSEAFISSVYTQSEWTAAFTNDPNGSERLFIPVKVKECNPPTLMKPIIDIDLMSLNENEAEKTLIEGLKSGRVKPSKKPSFPGVTSYSPYFPNSKFPNKEIHEKYKQLLKQEFFTLLDRLQNPEIDSQTSALFFGEGFPSGTKTVEPAISKYSLYMDIEKLLNATIGKYKSKLYHGVKDPKPHLIYKIATCRWRIFVSAVSDGLHEFNNEILYSSLIIGFESNEKNDKPELGLLNIIEKYIHYENTRNKREEFTTTKEMLIKLGQLATGNGVTIEDLLNEEQQKYRFHSKKEIAEINKRNEYYELKIFFSDVRGSYDLILQALYHHSINIVASKSWTLLPKEVAAAELLIEYNGNIGLKGELEAVFKSELLSNVFTRYELNEPNKKK